MTANPLLLTPDADRAALSHTVAASKIDTYLKATHVASTDWGARPMRAVVDLAAVLRADTAFGAFASALDGLCAADDGWGGARRSARDAGMTGDDVAIAVSLLLSERNASDAANRPLAVALAHAAVATFAVRFNAADWRASATVRSEAQVLAKDWSGALKSGAPVVPVG